MRPSAGASGLPAHAPEKKHDDRDGDRDENLGPEHVVEVERHAPIIAWRGQQQTPLSRPKRGGCQPKMKRCGAALQQPYVASKADVVPPNPRLILGHKKGRPRRSGPRRQTHNCIVQTPSATSRSAAPAYGTSLGAILRASRAKAALVSSSTVASVQRAQKKSARIMWRPVLRWQISPPHPSRGSCRSFAGPF